MTTFSELAHCATSNTIVILSEAKDLLIFP